MLKKSKKLKEEPMEEEEIIQYSIDSITDESKSSIKIDPDFILSDNESMSTNKISVKDDPFMEISQEFDSKTSEEVDLNSENEDSLIPLEESSTELVAEKMSHKRQKKKKTSIREESILRQQKLITNHPVRPPCGNCRLKCNERISAEVRDRTNKEFWSLIGLVNRRSFVLKLVKRCEIKRRKTVIATKKRNNVFMYYIKDNSGKEQQVCKKFFLTTLGFKASNDSIILNTMYNIDKDTLEPRMDMRGKVKNQDRMESRKKAIQQHVESYYPCVSHFQREDLPSKRYLPNDLTIKDMHADFIKKYSAHHACSYELYRTLLTEMNVTFAKAGSEECDMCELFNKHNSSHDKNNLSPDCDVCYKFEIHMKRDSEAKSKYHNLLTEIALNPDTAYYTTDLQKPLLLPKMDAVETFFTRRLVTFNKSFIPLGAVENSIRPFVYIWHEAIAGRQDEDILSVFYQFFLENRDKKRVVLWLDDSYHQNKNWKFLTFLTYIVNSSEVEIECVEVYYFEAGHNCLSTEAYFHQVDAALKRKGKIYDFKDFENTVKQASSRALCKSMTPWDFRDFKDLSSPQKLKTLISKPLKDDIRYLRGVRGSYVLKYRMNYDDNVNLADLDFLQMKVAKFGFSRPEVVGAFRGIPEDKKKEIIEILVEKMPLSRRQFWYDLPEGDFLDLMDNYC